MSRFLDSNFEPIAHAYQESHHMSYTNIIQISDYCILDLYDLDYFGVFAKTSKIFKRDASWSLALLESRLSTIVPLKKKRSWNPKQTVLYTEVLVKEPFPKYFLLQIIQLKLEATIYQWIFQVPGIHDTFLASTLAYLATVGLCASCRKNWTSWSIRHGMRSFS